MESVVDIYLLGAPGVGKGTQAQLLHEKFGLVSLATGEILRKSRVEKTVLGEQVASYMDAGLLVPDNVMIRIVEENISLPLYKNGVILDGYPRTLVQAEMLTLLLNKMGRPKLRVLLLDVSMDELRRRLLGRQFCPQCKKTYHIESLPPKNKGFCDACGVALQTREDDKPETVERRLDAYVRNTMPLVEYYEHQGLLLRVNGNQPASSVFADICSMLGLNNRPLALNVNR